MAMLQCSLLALVIVTLVTYVHSVEIPNSIRGNAEVDCGEDYIDISWTLEDDFRGRVFVVGHANDPDCVIAADTDNLRSITTIKIPKDKCGVTVTQSTNPPGIYVNTKVMVSFHKNFVTKVDRGFEISCFYMEVDKTVTFPLLVSMKDLSPLTFLAEMPRCVYEVLDPASLETATIVAVGDPLLHKWTCESNSPDLWCMTVHTCYVEDGQGTQAIILDEEGCEKDRFLLRNLNYGEQTPEMRAGHLMASQEAHAFKFADRVVVNFQCSIQLEIKGDEDYLNSQPRPVCASTLGNGQRARSLRRQTRNAEVPPVGDVVVRSRQVDVLDPVADFGLDNDDDSFRRSLNRVRADIGEALGRSDCIQRHTQLAVYAFTLFTLCVVAVASVILCRRK